MFTRALLAWLVLLALAVVNGAAREAWLIPRIGESAGHAVSSLALSALIFLLSMADDRMDQSRDCQRCLADWPHLAGAHADL